MSKKVKDKKKGGFSFGKELPKTTDTRCIFIGNSNHGMSYTIEAILKTLKTRKS